MFWTIPGVPGRALALAGVLALGAATVQAQGYEGAGLSQSQSVHDAGLLADALGACAALDMVYRFDCVRNTTRSAARRLTNNAAYWEVEVALTRVSRQMYQWVRQFEDPEADRLRHNGDRLRAVQPEAVPALRDVARQVMQAAVTDMQRGSPSETPFFQPIARAVADQTVF